MKLTGYSTDKVKHSYPLDPNPTQAEPGTLEKLEVMIRRRKKGYAIFHPLDNLNLTEENVCVRLLVGGVRESNNRASGRQRKSRAKNGYDGLAGRLPAIDRRAIMSRGWEQFK